jgi:beta-glucosidase
MKKTAQLFSSCTALLVAGILTGPGQAQTPAKAPYLDASLPTEKRIDDLMPRLTLEEKLEMVHGNGKFRSGGVPRLGVPYLWTADGPQGVREEGNLHTWEPIGATNDFATAMPVGMALASSWNPELAAAYGKVIGEEARQREKHVMLGPALNIMRTPLCGRNYDYFGEDPWLAGRMTVGYVKGMQAEQVVACLKHFALNNQEFMRWMINVEVDERPLREIYLSAFEAGVKEGGALSAMGAYNKFRGQYCCQNDYLLNQVLKKEWGFQGGVISDWGGTHETDGAVLGGLDLEMGSFGPYDKYFLSNPFKEGLKSGKYPMVLLDDKVRRNLRMLYFSGAVDGRRPGFINTPEHLAVAKQVAQEGCVLLKNHKNLLPIDPSQYKTIAVIGENAVLKYAAGHGAAGVKAFHEVTALEGILARVGTKVTVQYSAGYRHPNISWRNMRDVAGVRSSDLTAATPGEENGLRERAIRAAKESDLVIYVGGLCHQIFQDDEGLDRKDLSLPARQDALIGDLVAANPRTVVVLIGGSPVTMPWLDQVPAVMQFWYGGSEAGNALAALLFGDANPSGKLPCTFPKMLKDSPAHFTGSPRSFPGENGTVHYDEGLLVGYRWFDTKKIEPLFPFGFGLSYTTFSYGNLKVVSDGGSSATVECEITNTGAREGAEVVQVYVQPRKPSVQRPLKELKGFTKVSLKPGETKKVSVSLNGRSFAYYAPDKKGWVAEAGEYGVLVGASSRDIRLSGAVGLAKTEQVQ